MLDRKKLIPIYFVCLWYSKHVDSMPLDALSQRILSHKDLVRSNLAIPSVPKLGIRYLDEPLTDVDIAIHDAKKALKNVYDGIKNQIPADDMGVRVDVLNSAMKKLEKHEQRRFMNRELEDFNPVIYGWARKQDRYSADDDGGAAAAAAEKLAQVLEDERVAKELHKKMDVESAFDFSKTEPGADEGKWKEEWEILPTRGHGDCFFHAVIGSAGLTVDHAELRRGLVDFMQNNPDLVLPGGLRIIDLISSEAPISADPKVFFNDYLNRMRTGGTWATDVEREAMQQYLGIRLVTVWETPHGSIGAPAFNLAHDDGTIFIYFHMHGHYSSMRRRR